MPEPDSASQSSRPAPSDGSQRPPARTRRASEPDAAPAPMSGVRARLAQAAAAIANGTPDAPAPTRARPEPPTDWNGAPKPRTPTTAFDPPAPPARETQHVPPPQPQPAAAYPPPPVPPARPAWGPPEGQQPQAVYAPPAYPRSAYPPPPAASAGRPWSIAGLVCGLLAIVFVPIILGPLGAVFGFIAHGKGDRMGLWVGIGSIATTILGMLLAFALMNSLDSSAFLAG